MELDDAATCIDTSLPPDLADHRPEAASVEVRSVQRNPDAEVPVAPSAEKRIEDRKGVVAAVIERPKIGLCVAYVARRPIPSGVPTTRRRRSVPAARRRRAIPVRRRPTGRRPAIPAESARRRRRRRAVVGCAEAVRRIPGAALLRTAAVVETSGPVRRRRRSSRPARATRSVRSARFTRPTGSPRCGSTRATRSVRSAGFTRATRSPGSVRSTWCRCRLRLRRRCRLRLRRRCRLRLRRRRGLRLRRRRGLRLRYRCRLRLRCRFRRRFRCRCRCGCRLARSTGARSRARAGRWFFSDRPTSGSGKAGSAIGAIRSRLQRNGISKPGGVERQS
jgi:hypothetical protein